MSRPQATPTEAQEISLRKICPVLRVSSVVISRETNYILYPEAQGLEVQIVFVEPFAFDTRLFVPTRVV
jgi:hypothetical protein